MLRIPVSILQALKVKPAGRPAASRQTRDARHIQKYIVWRPDAKGSDASPQNVSSHGPSSTATIHFSPQRPCALHASNHARMASGRPHTELALEPPCTRFEVLLLEQAALGIAALGISHILHRTDIHSSSTEVGTMTSISSARSIHSGKQSLPPPDALCCYQNYVVLGDRSCPAAACLLAGCCCCCCSRSCPSCPC